MTRNCLNVMRKVAADMGPLEAAYLTSPAEALVSRRLERRPSYMVNRRPSMVRNVGGNLRWLYNNTEEALKNYQEFLQRNGQREQDLYNRWYDTGAKVSDAVVNRHAPHITNRIIPAATQLANSGINAAAASPNRVANLYNRISNGWEGQAAEKLGGYTNKALKHLNQAQPELMRSLQNANRSVRRSQGAAENLGRSLTDRFFKGLNK